MHNFLTFNQRNKKRETTSKLQTIEITIIQHKNYTTTKKEENAVTSNLIQLVIRVLPVYWRIRYDVRKNKPKAIINANLKRNAFYFQLQSQEFYKNFTRDFYRTHTCNKGYELNFKITTTTTKGTINLFE